MAIADQATRNEAKQLVLGRKIQKRVHTMRGSRVGFTYTVIDGWNGIEKLFAQPPEGMDRRLAPMLESAGSYWGTYLSDLARLSRHLKTPAPKYSIIAGRNDDAWIATEGPDVILHMDGIDFKGCTCGWTGCSGDEYYSGVYYIKVPARLLRDELLDRQEAEHALLHVTNDPDSGRDLEWGDENEYYSEVIRGKETPPEAFDQYPKCYIRLSDDNKPTIMFGKEPGGYSLSQELKSGEIYGSIPEGNVIQFCHTIPNWPRGASPDILFILCRDVIVNLGVKKWAEHIGLTGWDWNARNPRQSPKRPA